MASGSSSAYFLLATIDQKVLITLERRRFANIKSDKANETIQLTIFPEYF